MATTWNASALLLFALRYCGIAATVLILCSESVLADPFFGYQRSAFLGISKQRYLIAVENISKNEFPLPLHVRGGGAAASLKADDEYDNDESEEIVVDEEEEEEEEDGKLPDASLAAAALKSVTKAKAKEKAEKISTAKKAVNVKLLASDDSVQKTTKPKHKKKTSLAKMLHIPYIVRATLKPFTFFAMTKAYWASLFNLNYLKNKKPEPAQELRSALQEKARRSPSSGGDNNKGKKKKMKPGQARTLSDLPQLSQ